MGIDMDVIETVECKRLRWFGYVQRMGEQRWPTKVLRWNPSNRRKRGRPRKSWREEVKHAMEGRGLGAKDWRDRRRWKLGCEKRRQP